MRSMLSAAWFVMRVAWRTSPWALVVTLGEVVSTILRFTQPLLVGLVIQGVIDHDAGLTTVGTALLLGALGLGGVLEAFAVDRRVQLIGDIGAAFDDDVIRHMANISDLDRLEEPKLAASIATVAGRADEMGFCFNGIVSVAIQSVAPLVSIAVAITVDPRLLLVVAAGLPALLVTRGVITLEDAADERAQPHASEASAWAGLVPSPEAQAERQTFALGPWYKNRLQGALRDREQAFEDAVKRDILGSLVADGIYLAGAAAIVGWMVTSGDGLSAGEMAATLLVTADLKGTLGAFRFAVTNFGPALRAAQAIREVHHAALEPVTSRAETSPHTSDDQAIRLVDVTYRYSNASDPALDEVNLTVAPGTVIAIVGPNGAGKSTLAEMLLGLRSPMSGSLHLPSGQQSMIAQEYGRLEFRLAESVALTDQSKLKSDGLDRVARALQSATSEPFWDNDLTTQAGAGWSDGTDFSVGQWQSIAAARCFYIQRPNLVVLDEPTSALDPGAQESMTNRYMKLAHSVAESGGIAILITHRMSMPQRADLIVVMERGRIIETGPHDELLRRSGVYATAFNAQADGFLNLVTAPVSPAQTADR